MNKKENKYEVVLDAHTHTIASGHAYSTIRKWQKPPLKKAWNFWVLRSIP